MPRDDESLKDLLGLDLTALGKAPVRTSLDEVQERAQARVDIFRPVTVDERLLALRGQGFYPHGIYLPADDDLRQGVVEALRDIGNIQDPDARQRDYLYLQETGSLWEQAGVRGRWTGQQAWTRSTAQFRLVAVGRRGGKSSYAANEAVAMARLRPRFHIWLCAPTMKLVGRCFKMVDDLIHDLGVMTKVRRNTEQSMYIELENGSTIEGVSLEDPKIAAGAVVDLAIVDEAAQILEASWVRGVMPPLADHNGSALLIGSWEGQEGFFFEIAAKARADGSDEWDVFQDPSWEVNFYMFPQGRQSAAIKVMERNMNPVDFLEQFGAIPARNKLRVFPEFREKVHVGDYPFNPDHPVIVCADPSGGAAEYGILAIQDYQEYVVVIDEVYIKATTSAELHPLLNSKIWRPNVKEMIVDSAAFVEVEHWARLGWPAYPVHDKPPVQDRLPLHRNLLRDPQRYYMLHRQMMDELLLESGRQENEDYFLSAAEQKTLAITIEERLSDEKISDAHLQVLRDCARLFVDRHCVWTIMEHKLYSYPRGRRAGNLNIREKPADAYDHLLDCLTGDSFVETARGSIRIPDVLVGDLVLTRQGYKAVTRVWEKHPAAEIIRVTLSNGETLEGTPDHPIWIRYAGWTPLQDLKVGDRPVIVSECTDSPSLANSMEFATTDTQILPDDIVECTGGRHEGNRYTSRYGNANTDQFPLTTMFITETGIRSTTISPISNASPKEGISPSMSRSESRSFESAFSAERPTRRGIVENRSCGTAGETAKRLRGVLQAWMTKIASAVRAAKPSAPPSISPSETALGHAVRVVATERLTGHFPVYDLTVDDAHEFFANGVLVSNCFGYFCWMHHRFDDGAQNDRRTRPLVGNYDTSPVQLPRPAPQYYRPTVLDAMRRQTGSRGPRSGNSLLVRGR